MQEPTEPSIVEREAADPQPNSLLEQLAAKRKEISETRETFIPIPGYDREPPLLLARYRLLEGPELTTIGKKNSISKGSAWDKQLNAVLDTLDRSCTGIYVDQGTGAPEPLTYNGNPIAGFDNDLAEALSYAGSLPASYTHRDVIVGLFGGNEVMVTQHAYLLNRWFGDTTIDVSAELMAGNL